MITSSSTLGKLVFQVEEGDGTSEIYRIDADGYNLARLTYTRSTNSQPVLSPDGKYVAFQSGQDGNWGIHVMGADGSNPHRVGSRDIGGIGPSWSPNGQELVFTCPQDNGKSQNLCIISLDSTNYCVVAKAPPSFGSPWWSPDGNCLVFEVSHGLLSSGSTDIYSMVIDGSHGKPLTSTGDSFSPVWSPDGRSIAFVSGRSRRCLGIYVMDADGSNQRPVTNIPCVDYRSCAFNPAWSPDGREIAFVSGGAYVPGGSENYEIYIIHRDGTAQRQLTHLGKDIWHPSWSLL